jgi:glutathionyl-hydroquinone reductase
VKLDRKAIATDEFKHQADAFRSWATADNLSPFPLAQGRYHFYISLACPCASRTFIVRKVKRLEQAVNFDHIKRRYYVTHDDINPTRIVPLGPVLDLQRPHEREHLT